MPFSDAKLLALESEVEAAMASSMFRHSRRLAEVRPEIRAAAAIGAAVMIACLVGIWTRPVGFLATIWPANAVMLGMLLRFPATGTRLGWLAATVGFITADLLTGSSLLKAVILNTANLVGIAAAYYLVYSRLDQSMRQLRHPESMLYLLVASVVGGAAAGCVGGIANPMLFGGGVIEGWTFWFVTETMNYITVLPTVLTFPDLRPISPRAPSSESWRRGDLKPAMALIVSCAVAVLVGGQGAIAFPVPALLWCGLTYSVFSTSVLTLLFGCWSLTATSFGWLPNLSIQPGEMAIVSLRMGICFIAIGPIMLASVMSARNELQSKLEYLASHDQLTGAMNRASFRGAIPQAGDSDSAIALLLIDFDHFKQINDTLGHSAGDSVLINCSQRVHSCLRDRDLFGRVGGEEFAALLRVSKLEEAAVVAERIRRVIADEPVALGNGRSVAATVSIGVATASSAGNVDNLFLEADNALYNAKRGGRNKVEFAGSPS